MLKSITLKWKLFVALMFSWGFVLSWLNPITGHDEWLYSIMENPLYLQWLEYLIWHGRILTHSLMRLALQLGDPWMHVIKAGLITMLLILCVHQYNPYFWKRNSTNSLYSMSLFFLFISLFMFIFFMMFYKTEFAVFFSNYLPIIFILLFLGSYIHYLVYLNESSTLRVIVSGVLAGAAHEQSSAVIPMILIITVLLKVKKIRIPVWFWIGLIAFICGFLILMLSPGSKVRLNVDLFPDHLAWVKGMKGITFLGHSYGGVEKWWWFGQELNWLDLGWKRYFYSFYRHIFVAMPNWYSGPGWLPSTWYIHIIFILSTYSIYRKTKNMLSNEFLLPALYYVFSWGTVFVMMFSPMFHWNSLEVCRIFLYIALCASLFNFSLLYNFSERFKKYFSLTVLITVFIGQALHVFPFYKAQKEYRYIISLFQEAQQKGDTVPKIPPVPKATLFGQVITDYLISPTMLQYFDLDGFVTTNEQGEIIP